MQGVGDNIAKGIFAMIVGALIVGALIIGGIWFAVSYFSDDETVTDEKIQPKEIIITVNPETGQQDTTYVYPSR